MPDADPSQGVDSTAPAIAPPGGPPPGLQSAPGGLPPGMTSGAGGGGVLPPSASAPPAGANIHPAGLHQVGMDLMRKLMGNMHVARAMLDPSSEEAKAADSMFQKGRKHFIPDMQSAGSGMPPGMMGGAPQGGPPQGGAMLPAMGQNNLPTGPPPMRFNQRGAIA